MLSPSSVSDAAATIALARGEHVGGAGLSERERAILDFSEAGAAAAGGGTPMVPRPPPGAPPGEAAAAAAGGGRAGAAGGGGGRKGKQVAWQSEQGPGQG